MNLTIENLLLIGSILLLISVLAGKTSYRFGVPTLLLFLSIGMLAGSDGLLGIHFEDAKLAQFIGLVSLNFILFSGGLDTNWNSIKPVLWQGITLSTLGVFITAMLLGIFVWQISDFSLFEGLLLGAIVSSTDAAAVFSILRTKSLGLKHNLRPTLELESGSNDPMAYVLTLAFLSLVVNPENSVWSIIPLFLQQMTVGAISGLSFAYASKWVLNSIKLDFEGLYPVLVTALMFLTFSATDFLGGNGFLAVYLCSVYLGNQDIIHKKTIIRWFDGIAWLMQIVLFLTLGLLVYPSQIVPVIGIGLLISGFLMFVARPVSVFIGLSLFKIKLRSLTYISWVGLRGAVPIVFATYPLLAGIDKAPMIFNIVFFISVTSVMLQGTTLSKVANWLHVSLPDKVKKRDLTELFTAENPKSLLKEIEINPSCHVVGKRIVDIGFPKNAIIALINRKEAYFVPSGSTEIEENDTLIVLSDTKQNINQVFDCLKLPKSED